jgi:hypothetical protein
MIFVPAIIMLIFGLVAGGTARNLPIIVDNQDAGYTIPTGQNPTNRLNSTIESKLTLEVTPLEKQA